ncbi:ABC transporter permease subunit [Conexibacter sp. CPCC 206217]|nr:ABC transporter permease subunit [Conexibacter sp. CPCC 206217]MDO8208823.1 ABC transporter permease subunit [Conexibacter sp. CPCC 206217]
MTALHETARAGAAGSAVTSGAAVPPARRTTPLPALLAAAAWAAAGALTLIWPDEQVSGLGQARVTGTGLVAAVAFALAGLALAGGLIGLRRRSLGARLAHAVPWLVVLAALFTTWELLTAKTGTLTPPYWASPQRIQADFRSDHVLLLQSLWSSLRLLLEGYAIGALTGVLVGVAMGWSQRVNYWLHPILRTIGPLPPVALIPIMFVLLPSSGSASLLLIALSAWFPVTVLTFSGVSGVSRAYYDVALTLGARSRFLVTRVAVPAALPSIFVGLFMGLGMTFPTLVIAEMLGARNGLGWYVQWQQHWSAYPKMYVALVLMVVLFSGLLTLLFVVRDRVLAWQRGLVRW